MPYRDLIYLKVFAASVVIVLLLIGGYVLYSILTA